MNEEQDNVMAMPVTEVIAYLTEMATYHQMILDRLTAQIEGLGQAMTTAEEAANFADSSKDVD